jgi:hypothetical protein
MDLVVSLWNQRPSLLADDWKSLLPDTEPGTPAEAKDNLSSTLGKAEMEWAAKLIIQDARKRGDWLGSLVDQRFKDEDKSHPGDPGYFAAGFYHLVMEGWLEPKDTSELCFKKESDHDADAEFVVTEEFIRRVTDTE